jgi:hypothetical protein
MGSVRAAELGYVAVMSVALEGAHAGVAHLDAPEKRRQPHPVQRGDCLVHVKVAGNELVEQRAELEASQS